MIKILLTSSRFPIFSHH